MEKLKKLCKKLFCLSPLTTVLIAAPCFGFVFIMLVTENKSLAAYLSYLLSTYALVITGTKIPSIVRALKRGWNRLPPVKKFRKTTLGRKLLGDTVFRSELTLHSGLLVNVLYATLNLISGIRYQSLWFVSLSFYYFLLCATRGLLVGQIHRAPVGENLAAEWRSYRTCGIILLLMNQALTGIVIYIVNLGQGFTYPGILIYAMAAYTFYVTIASIINVIKFPKQGSPLLSASKMISLTAALVSMLSLETAMLARFGADQPEFRRWMTGLSGGAICVFVLGMAVYMIAHACKKLKQL